MVQLPAPGPSVQPQCPAPGVQMQGSLQDPLTLLPTLLPAPRSSQESMKPKCKSGFRDETTRSEKCPEGEHGPQPLPRPRGSRGRRGTGLQEAHRESHDVVGCGAHRVHILLLLHASGSHRPSPGSTPAGPGLPVLCDDDLLLVVSLRQVHVHLARGRAGSGWAGGGGRRVQGWTCSGHGRLTLLICSMPCRVCPSACWTRAAQEGVVVHLVHHLFLLQQKPESGL